MWEIRGGGVGSSVSQRNGREIDETREASSNLGQGEKKRIEEGGRVLEKRGRYIERKAWRFGRTMFWTYVSRVGEAVSK